MSHGKPIEGQENVLYVGHLHYFRIVVDVDEIAMIWKPTDSKNNNQNNQHSDNLEQKQELSLTDDY